MSSYNIFNTAIYLRLSRDDGTEKESESIQNQKTFLTQYVVKNGFNLIDIYIDDGFSGTNFDRPDFQRLISDIENGRINCVITKDLSRLGRDYIMTGHYLERYFPQHNVRYIAVNDGIDTFADNTSNDMTPFKAVFNDMYAKDISKKVRTALNTKKENGIFIGSVPPYGYKKDPLNKGHLIVDEETAIIVKRIYSMFLSGATKLGIANQLSSEYIPTPSEGKGLKATQKHHKGVWNEVIIKRILTNPTYIGNLTQNRARKINYKLQLKKNLPKEQWIIVEDTHEPIITEEDFNMVQELLKKRMYKPKEGTPHLLSGLLECGNCHSNMTFARDDTRMYVVCSAWRKHTRLKICTPHRIREDYLEKEIINQLQIHVEKYLDKDKIIDSSSKAYMGKEEISTHIHSLEKRLDEITNIITTLYVDKTKDIISEKDFISINQRFNSERETIGEQINLLNKQLAEFEGIKENANIIRNLLEEFLSFETIDRTTLAMLIQKIEIFEGKQIKIHFNFKMAAVQGSNRVSL